MLLSLLHPCASQCRMYIMYPPYHNLRLGMYIVYRLYIGIHLVFLYRLRTNCTTRVSTGYQQTAGGYSAFQDFLYISWRMIRAKIGDCRTPIACLPPILDSTTPLSAPHQTNQMEYSSCSATNDLHPCAPHTGYLRKHALSSHLIPLMFCASRLPVCPI